MNEPFIILENQDHASWLKARTYGIGGSDASAIVGMNPYKTNIDLFEEKIGRRVPEDISDKPYVKYGTWQKNISEHCFPWTIRNTKFLIMKTGYCVVKLTPFCRHLWTGNWKTKMEEKEFWKLKPQIYCRVCSMRNGKTEFQTTITYRSYITCLLPDMNSWC